MSKLTLDEAIEYYINVATQRAVADEGMGVNDKWNETKFMTKKESEQIIADNRQIAEWLTELKELRSLKTDCVFFKAEAKKLLKAVVKDMNATVAEVYNGGLLCKCCKWKSRTGECCCPGDGGCDVAYQWRYVDEAEKLLNDEK